MSTIARLALSIPRAGTAAGSAADTRRFTRLLLHPREVCRIDRGYRWARVLSGTAWITGCGEDILIRAGGMRALPDSREPLVLSGVGVAPLAVELGG